MNEKIAAALKSIEGQSGDYELGLLVAGWGDTIIPAALRLTAAVEDWRYGGSTPHTLVLMYAYLDDFIAVLPEAE